MRMTAICPRCGSVKVTKSGKAGICGETDCGHVAAWKEFKTFRHTDFTKQELQGGRAYVPTIGDEGAVPQRPRYPRGNRRQPLNLEPP